MIRIPFSLNYLNPRKGFSPYLAYEFDLNNFAGTQAIKIGCKYRMNELSVALIAGVNTALIIYPYGAFVNLGLVFDMNRKKQ